MATGRFRWTRSPSLYRHLSHSTAISSGAICLSACVTCLSPLQTCRHAPPWTGRIFWSVLGRQYQLQFVMEDTCKLYICGTGSSAVRAPVAQPYHVPVFGRRSELPGSPHWPWSSPATSEESGGTACLSGPTEQETATVVLGLRRILREVYAELCPHLVSFVWFVKERKPLCLDAWGRLCVHRSEVTSGYATGASSARLHVPFCLTVDVSLFQMVDGLEIPAVTG